MKIVVIFIGKTTDSNIKALVDNYAARIVHYTPFEIITAAEPKNTAGMSQSKQCKTEGELIKRLLRPDDLTILLDERGKELRSIEFADKLKRMQQIAAKRIVFIVGGPYGFSPEIKTLAKEQLSLSRMTFSHQMVRVVFAEQLYRALTIIRGEPYHHE